jgi:type III secretion protein S
LQDTLYFFQKGLGLVIWLSLLPLAVAVLVGMLVSLVQTVLSMQDQSLPFAFKLIAVSLTLALAGRWLGVEIVRLGEQAFEAIATVSASRRGP